MNDDEIKISIFKRAGSDVYQMQYRDPVTGSKIRKSTKTNKKREAERLGALWQRDIQSGKDWRHGRMEWQEFRLSLIHISEPTRPY